MKNSKLIVIVLSVWLTSQLSGSEPTIQLEFEIPGGLLTIQVPADEIEKFRQHEQFPLGEFKPVLGSHNGQLEYRLSDKVLPELQVGQRKSSIVERFERQSAMIVKEIEENCTPSFEQLSKLELAANSECRRVGKLMDRLEQQSTFLAKALTDDLLKLAHEVDQVNEVISGGPLREGSLLRSMCNSMLDAEQLAVLRKFYVQPLLKIFSERGVTSGVEQKRWFDQCIRELDVDPYVLRDSYGEQYRAVMGLGEPRLLTILSSQQIGLLKQLGETEYRITLSLSRQASKPAIKPN